MMDPRLSALALEALHYAAMGHEERAETLVDEVREHFGEDGLKIAIGVWCDVVTDKYTGHEDVTVEGIDFQYCDTGAVTSADEVPPATRWAGQILTARIARDIPNFEAFLATLPADPEPQAEYVAAILTVAGLTTRRLWDEYRAADPRARAHLN